MSQAGNDGGRGRWCCSPGPSDVHLQVAPGGGGGGGGGRRPLSRPLHNRNLNTHVGWTRCVGPLQPITPTAVAAADGATHSSTPRPTTGRPADITAPSTPEGRYPSWVASWARWLRCKRTTPRVPPPLGMLSRAPPRWRHRLVQALGFCRASAAPEHQLKAAVGRTGIIR